MDKSPARKAAEQYIETANDHDLDGWTELFAPTVEVWGGEEVSRDELRAGQEVLFDAFPDGHFDLHSIVSEGNQTVFRLTFSGTHENAYFNIEPTGESVEVPEMIMISVNPDTGLIDGAWILYDRLGFHEQLNVLEDPIQ